MKSQDLLLIMKLISLEKYSQLLEPEEIEVRPLHNFINKITDEPMPKYIDIKENSASVKYDNTMAKYMNEYLNHLKDNIVKNHEGVLIKSSIPALFEKDKYSVRSLEKSIGVSRSQVSISLKRCLELKLIYPNGNADGGYLINKKSVMNIIEYAIPYFFPVEKTSNVKGIPISFSSPFLYNKILSQKKMPLVWPDTQGILIGEGVIPFDKYVPHAVRRDPLLYEMLVLVDSVRMNIPRESSVALEALKKIVFK